MFFFHADYRFGVNNINANLTHVHGQLEITHAKLNMNSVINNWTSKK